MDAEVVSRNLALQQAWYGEPIGETVRRLTRALHITQAQLADVAGLSAPMLSQLASGQRAKIANPAVLGRLELVAEIANDPALPGLPTAEIDRRLQQIRSNPATSTFTGSSGSAGAMDVGSALRAVATPAEIEDAAWHLQGSHPRLAEFLRAHAN